MDVPQRGAGAEPHDGLWGVQGLLRTPPLTFQTPDSLLIALITAHFDQSVHPYACMLVMDVMNCTIPQR